MSLASQSSSHLTISSNTNKVTVIKEIQMSNSSMQMHVIEEPSDEKEIEVITLDDDDDDDDVSGQLSANSEDSALGLDSYQDFQSEMLSPTEFHLSSSNQSVGYRRDDFRAHLSSNQRMIHTTDPFSSVINSSISTSSLPLPKNINSSNTDNVMPFEMSAKFSDSPIKYDNLRRIDHSNEITEEWTKKSHTAISSYLKKSISSSSSSTSSGCSSDVELVNSPIDDHNHHDTAPDSPDSGVSGSLNSSDDLKHVDDEEEDIENIDCPVGQSNRPSLEILNFNNYSEFNSIQINNSGDETKRTESTCSDDLMHSDHLGVASQLSVTAKNLSTQLHCKWRDCDWPGSYEELAEHVREIHVELQPFLDPISGKLIKWSKHKCRDKSATEEEEDDSISNASDNEENEENDEEDDEVEPMDPDDDSQSVGSNSSCRVTRRSNRVQGLFDYSQSNSRSYKLRQSSRLNDQRMSSEKPSENQFVCLWKGCKVYGKPSSSRQFLERHVLELHSGPKPFKCIVDRCGQRFKSQTSLQRHVNTHFKGTNVANCMSTLINSTAVQAINNKNNDKRHSTNNCCCRCTCHSCLVCDKSTNGDDKPAIRLDKNRCTSTDSAISLNSSNSLPSLSGAQTKSLSKSPHSSNATTEHCQVNCCMSASKPRSDNLATILLQKSKVSKNNKKSAPSIRPNVKGWSQFDFYDQCSANEVIYQIRSQQTSKLNLNHSYVRIGHMSKGKFVAKSDSNDSDLSEDEPNEESSNLDKDENSDVARIPKVKRKIVERFQNKLFRNNQTEGNFLFYSEVVGACYSNGEDKIRLRWHPLGLLSDSWVKKDDIEAHRSRSVPYTELPEQFRQIFKEKSQTKHRTNLERSSKPLNRKRKLMK